MTKSNLKVVKSTKDQEMDIKEKNKALDAAIAQITDNFGKGSVMKLGQRRAMDIESVSTGSLSLDLALGIGGLPKGRIVEVYGPESSGKTTLALQVVAEAQKLVVFVHLLMLSMHWIQFMQKNWCKYRRTFNFTTRCW